MKEELNDRKSVANKKLFREILLVRGLATLIVVGIHKN